MNLQDIRGNEHVKRAIEVALVNDLSITFVGDKDLSILFANMLLEMKHNDVRCQRLCFCGNYASVKLCACTNREINFLRMTQDYQEALSAHIVSQVVCPTFEQIVSKRLPESDNAILTRVLNARQRYKKYSAHDLDDVCLKLLKAFSKEYNGINQLQIEKIRGIAIFWRSILGILRMKAKDLAKILLENPNFDVVVCFFDEHYEGSGVTTYLRVFNATEFYDVGFLDKQIVLGIKEIDS